ncbi:hypothetical protein HN008_21025 [Vibrio parahaemolyticus]|nr:hypothetical protein [Vibrio parahaemolyticus]MBX5339221.1 hypothetical protein [Vibrio parahaemolyticus]
MKAYGQRKKLSKKEMEHLARQARARRQLEIMLNGIGLNPYLDAKLITQ